LSYYVLQYVDTYAKTANRSLSDSFLDEPVLTGPSNEDKICRWGTDLNLDFTWNAVAGADYYILQVCQNSNFVGPTLRGYQTSTNSQTLELGTDLYYGRTYFWRVMAYSTDGGTSPKSEVRSFEIKCNELKLDQNQDQNCDTLTHIEFDTVPERVPCNTNFIIRLRSWSYDDDNLPAGYSLSSTEWQVEGPATAIGSPDAYSLEIKPGTCDSGSITIRFCLKFSNGVDNFDCCGEVKTAIDCKTTVAPPNIYPVGTENYYTDNYLYGGVQNRPYTFYDYTCYKFNTIYYQYAWVQFPYVGEGLGLNAFPQGLHARVAGNVYIDDLGRIQSYGGYGYRDGCGLYVSNALFYVYLRNQPIDIGCKDMLSCGSTGIFVNYDPWSIRHNCFGVSVYQDSRVGYTTIDDSAYGLRVLYDCGLGVREDGSGLYVKTALNSVNENGSILCGSNGIYVNVCGDQGLALASSGCGLYVKIAEPLYFLSDGRICVRYTYGYSYTYQAGCGLAVDSSTTPETLYVKTAKHTNGENGSILCGPNGIYINYGCGLGLDAGGAGIYVRTSPTGGLSCSGDLRVNTGCGLYVHTGNLLTVKTSGPVYCDNTGAITAYSLGQYPLGCGLYYSPTLGNMYVYLNKINNETGTLVCDANGLRVNYGCGLYASSSGSGLYVKLDLRAGYETIRSLDCVSGSSGYGLSVKYGGGLAVYTDGSGLYVNAKTPLYTTADGLYLRYACGLYIDPTNALAVKVDSTATGVISCDSNGLNVKNGCGISKAGGVLSVNAGNGLQCSGGAGASVSVNAGCGLTFSGSSLIVNFDAPLNCVSGKIGLNYGNCLVLQSGVLNVDTSLDAANSGGTIVWIDPSSIYFYYFGTYNELRMSYTSYRKRLMRNACGLALELQDDPTYGGGEGNVQHDILVASLYNCNF